MNTVKRFQRKKEDFTCEVCKTEVVGTGYTNHCPECLTSKHVDIFPGDRLEECGGVMPVTEIIRKGDGYTLVHSCQTCKYSHTDHFRDNADNIDSLIKLSQKLAKEKK